MKLLAKTGKDAPTLLKHTNDVLAAAQHLFGDVDALTSFGGQWVRFFSISDSASFLKCLHAAILFHDIGKANDGFQAAVNRDFSAAPSRGQLLRHEHLSGLILCLPSVQKWTSERTDIDWDVVLAAVISHHCKVSDPVDVNARFHFARLNQGQTSGTLQFLGDTDDFRAVMKTIKGWLKLSESLPDFPTTWTFRDRQPENAIDLRPRSSQFIQQVDARLAEFTTTTTTSRSRFVKKTVDPVRRRLLWAARSALIVADAVGSGLVREGLSIHKWIEGVIHQQPDSSMKEIYEQIIKPRVTQLKQLKKWDSTKGNEGWSEFQERCDQLPSRSLLIAPCGSGKTLAAWRWIAAQCDTAVSNSHPVQRAIFLYPTRATATEGFRDYVSWAPESSAALMHGTAAFELEGLFENPTEHQKDVRNDRNYETSERLFALGFWQKRFFAATVDQFLGFMQYSYSSLVMLPVLAQSVIVVDEVHSFDKGLFSALQEFLKNFKIPVLCMTASLTENRKEQLVNDCGLELCDDKSGDLQEIADAPRYSIHRLKSDKFVDEVRRQLAAGRKVLWVVNQVRRAQQAVCDIVFGADAQASPVELAERFAGADIVALVGNVEVPVFCYHSRFKLEDRRDRHSRVVRGFQSRVTSTQSNALLAVTTQVCEMSLDLDADVVITEMAPPTAMIQRMGRCNRVRTPRNDAGDVLIYRSENDLPYDRSQIDQAEKFIDQLHKLGRFSQADLERTLAGFPGDQEFPKSCQFLESGAFALSTADSLRDGEEFTAPAILPENLDEVLAAHDKRAPLDRWVTPVSLRWRRPESIDPRLPKHLIVAPPGHYHRAIGFCDEAVQQSSHESAAESC